MALRRLQSVAGLLNTVSRRNASSSQGQMRPPYVEPLLPKHTWKATKFLVGLGVFTYIMAKPEALNTLVTEFWMEHLFDDREKRERIITACLGREIEIRRQYLKRRHRHMVPVQPMDVIGEAENSPVEKRESSTFHSTF